MTPIFLNDRYLGDYPEFHADRIVRDTEREGAMMEALHNVVGCFPGTRCLTGWYDDPRWLHYVAHWRPEWARSTSLALPVHEREAFIQRCEGA